MSVSRAIPRLIVQALGWRPPGRAVQVRADDTFIVSYPKSGNTWVRFLIGSLCSAQTVDFSGIRTILPDIYLSTGKVLAKLRRPRLLKSHEYFDPRYRKVLYVVRDPRDVAVSYWHHYRRTQLIAADFALADFVSMFMNGELDPYGTWREHVGSWLGARRQHRFLFRWLRRFVESCHARSETDRRLSGDRCDR